MITNETIKKKDEDNKTKIDHEIDGKNNDDEQTTKQSMSQFVPSDSNFVKINTLSAFLLSYHKQLFVALVCIHVLIFHLDKIFFNAILIVLFCFGFLYYNLSNQSLNEQLDAYLKSNRQKCPNSAGLIKFDWYIESSSSNVNNSPNQVETNSINSLSRSRIQFDQRSLVNIKPSLTGSYAIDEELHSIIELVIRDYIDSWYKTHISSREEFDQALRVLIYNSIRNLNKCLKSIEWEQFIINIVAHSLIIHMRILKKAKEKMRLASSKTTTASEPLTTSNFQKMFINTINMSRANEKNLIEMFFDLEAEIEKSICRDGIAYNSKEIEDEFLQEMSEFLCYSCLPIDTFNCIAFKSVIREILAHHLIKTSINNITDPDYINQTVLYLSQNQEHSVDNFMITLNYCESLEELNELRIKLEENISKTRSNDKGGQNDQEIKLRLSSLAFVKRRIDIRMATVIKTMNRISSYSNRTISDQQQSSTSSGSFSPSEEEYKKFLFHANLNNLDFDTTIRNESIQLCFIEFMGKQNVQNLMSFYLNAEMFRQFARKELAKCSAESTTTPKPDIKETKLAIKDFAKGLINSYLLSAVNFTAMSQDEDEQPINLSNRIYYKKELVRTLENLENEDCINDSLLDELQEKIYLLMKQKYYPEFKNYPEFHKVLFKTDLIKQQSIQSAVESKAISSVSLSSISSSLSQSSTSSSQSILSPTSPTNNNASTRLINDALTSIDEDFGIDSGYMNESGLALDTSSISDQKTLNDDSDVLSLSADRVSQSSFEMWPPPTSSSQKSDIRLSAIITSAGRCNDIKSSYAIYIIDVTKQSETTNKIEFWQTYRRFNDFNDLHTLLKKRFPQINIVLPAKSFKSSLNDELIEKRIIELNRYLQMLTSQDMFIRYPGILELMLKFLENKRWESQNTLKKKFGLLLTPMISSVQNIQTTLINAPDNVIGMVKGVSEMVLNEATRSTSSALNTPLRNNDSLPRNNSQSSSSRLSNASNQSFFSNSMTPQNSSQQSPLISVIATPSSASNLRSPQNSAAAITDDNKELIDRTVLNDDDMQSNNLLIRVILLLIDEIFDLKEKNQWLRQPLMAIVRGYLKNIKGDSMNRKIKEQIANYLSEKEMARYLKNFRKRMWPKGYLADVMPERSRSVKEITKILAKTTLLSYVSDELRHILGNETTRRGVFDLFELFQHQTLNKRILSILTESLLTSLFSQPPTTTGGQSNTTSSLTSSLIMGSSSSTMVAAASTPPPITSWSSGSTRQTSFVLQALHLHLSQSNRVKPEWKLTSLTKQHHLLHSVSSISPSTSNHLNANLIDNDEQISSPPPSYSDQLTKRKTSMSRSKSLYNDIQC